MGHIYFISGLGADERVFRFLRLPDNVKIHFLRWFSPLPDESLSNYAFRLGQEIKESEPILIGLSFGGLVAMEMAKRMEVKKVIIISSFKTRSELPWLYKMAAWLRLNELIPTVFFKRVNILTYLFFGVNGTNDKGLLKNILAETDTDFLKWAIEKALHWHPASNNKNVFHIHGSRDKIIPLKYVRPDYIVKSGGHLMVLNKAKEISAVLNSQIEAITQTQRGNVRYSF